MPDPAHGARAPPGRAQYRGICHNRGMNGLPALFVRKQAKAYGTRKVAEGDDPSGRTVTLIEDVITTGGAVLEAATALRELGATVGAVVCAIDRSAPGPSVLAENGISLLSVLTKADLDRRSGRPPAD